jgi:putative ABC transport system substrate-binding protein
MNRRELLLLLGCAVAAPHALRAQQKAMPVIGYLDTGSPGAFPSYLAAFREALSETGYVEGRDVAVEYRWAEGRLNQLPALAAELVGRKVDVIVAAGGFVSVIAARGATSTIPIVFTGVSDPVGSGLIASLARPGGNITGFSPFALELLPKRVELIFELVPRAREIALLVNSQEPRAERLIKEVEEAAHTKGLQIQPLIVGGEGEIAAAFVTLVQRHADALLVSPDPFFSLQREKIVALAARHAVPAAYPWREDATVGGLISYGPSITAIRRQVGIYVGRILKGTKPADLPVQQPTTFELVINLKTAKALGLTIPPSILARADEVIE